MWKTSINCLSIVNAFAIILMKNTYCERTEQKAGFSSPNVVPSLIKGERELSLDAAKKLCLVMNVSLDYLTGLTDVKTSDVQIVDMCKTTGLTERAIESILYGNSPNFAVGDEEGFCQWLGRLALSDFIEENYSIGENSIFWHISKAYQHSGEACNILLRTSGKGAFQNTPARGKSCTESNNMKSQYILRKNYLLNGWMISVERQTEVSDMRIYGEGLLTKQVTN